MPSQQLQSFRIRFTKEGKQLVATVKAASQEEAVQKLRSQLAHDDTLRLSVQGTHCASCEVLIEQSFKKLPGVKDAKVDYRSGEALVTFDGDKKPNLAAFANALSGKGYQVTPWAEKKRHKWTKRDLREMGAVLLLFFGGYLVLRQFDILPQNLAVTEGATYPFIFLVGLVAAGSSCLAIVGGLLISMSGLYSQASTERSSLKRFQPHVLFNIGRLASYALLGGLIGLLGSALSLSSFASGAVTLLAALFMLLTGLSMLNVISRNPFLVSIPKRWQNAIHTGAEKQKKGFPFFIGAATFFLPCGFTQAMQLYAMTTGSFEKGALIMLIFALGTMPTLLGVGLLSTFTKGASYRYFLKFAGALVLFLGVFNLNNGLTLVGMSPGDLATSLSRSSKQGAELVATQDPNVIFDGQKQIVSMRVHANRYAPNTFTVKKGIPVEWHIEGVGVQGCTSALRMPEYRIAKQVKPGLNIVEFTPDETGTFGFHCSMGMYKGRFTVVD